MAYASSLRTLFFTLSVVLVAGVCMGTVAYASSLRSLSFTLSVVLVAGVYAWEQWLSLTPFAVLVAEWASKLSLRRGIRRSEFGRATSAIFRGGFIAGQCLQCVE